MGTRFDRQIARKDPELRALIIAIRDAIPHVTSEYDRDELLPIYLNALLGPETTTRGDTISETLRHVCDIFTRSEETAPEVVSAATLLRREVYGRRG